MIRPILAISLLTALAACSRPDDPQRLPRPNHETADKGLTVHEWGTYTSLQGSDGRTMPGLHHAEELLPSFVMSRDPMNPDHKGIGPVSAPVVTQKLETPVIYFYGEVERAEVTVRFPAGLITEWYPAAMEMSPVVGAPSPLSNGSMRWDVALFSGAVSSVSVPEDSVWAPSRRVASRGVRVGRTEEHFIFYRGLGAFERPVRVTTGGRGGISIQNDSDDAIPAAFFLSVDETGGSVHEVGAIAAHNIGSMPMPGASEKKPLEDYRVEARAALARALEATGLYADEAAAMVDTWNHSYFINPGTRVLYIAPRSWTDELLPIEIKPAPEELVRTLVGRIEVVLPSEEQAIVADLTDAADGKITLGPESYGRFTEPKLRRALELITDRRVRDYAQRLVDQAARLP